MKKKINLSRFGHSIPKGAPAPEIYTSLKNYIYEEKINDFFIFSNKLKKNCNNIIFNTPFAGFENFTKRSKQLKKHKFSLINTEWIVGSKNIDIKYFTFDNYLLCELDSNKKNIKYLLYFIYFNWFIKKKNFKFVENCKFKFLKKIFKRIFYNYYSSIFYINHNKASLFYYFFYQTSWWKEQYMRSLELMKTKNFNCLLEFPAGETKYGKILTKKLNKQYIGMRSAYSKSTEKKFYENKSTKYRDIDFFYSGKINDEIISKFEKLKKQTKLKIVYSYFLEDSKRKKFLNRSKFGLGISLNNTQSIFSAMRVAFHYSVNLPLFYLCDKYYQPHWINNLVYQSTLVNAANKMKNLVKNYKYHMKQFENKKKIFKLKSTKEIKKLIKLTI